MAENQRMCLYYESSTKNAGYFYCKSPGNSEPNASLGKYLSTFISLCRCADERCWQEKCNRFIVPESTAADDQTETRTVVNRQAGTEGETDNRQPRRRARERLTYLSQMSANGTQKNTEYGNAQVPPQVQSAGKQDGNGSSMAETILKAGAKTAVEIGKTMINPVGAGVDIAADVAKQVIDEL